MNHQSGQSHASTGAANSLHHDNADNTHHTPGLYDEGYQGLRMNDFRDLSPKPANNGGASAGLAAVELPAAATKPVVVTRQVYLYTHIFN